MFSCKSQYSAEEKHFIIVSADGSGDYKTLIEAVEALPMFVYQRRVIFIKNGIYEERIRIDQDNITLLGEGREKTIIQYNLPREEWEKIKITLVMEL